MLSHRSSQEDWRKGEDEFNSTENIPPVTSILHRPQWNESREKAGKVGQVGSLLAWEPLGELWFLQAPT